MKLSNTFRTFLFSVISNCIQLFVQDLEYACDPALTAMSKVRHSFSCQNTDIKLLV